MDEKKENTKEDIIDKLLKNEKSEKVCPVCGGKLIGNDTICDICFYGYNFD